MSIDRDVMGSRNRTPAVASSAVTNAAAASAPGAGAMAGFPAQAPARNEGGPAAVEWRTSDGLVAYETALAEMNARATAVAEGAGRELVWLIEHPPLYTAGTSAKDDQLIEARFPVHAAGRGGQLTYHGPGQRVVYVMLDLKHRGPDVRGFVAGLEEWMIRTLGEFGVTGERRAGRIGVWVRRPDKGAACEDKIAAIGVRIKHWVTLHGIALNVDCDLSHYAGIVPCGIREPRCGITSLADLGVRATLPEVDQVLRREFEEVFKSAEPYHRG